MRVSVVTSALLLAGCASSPTDNTAAIDRSCTVEGCFLERDVRDFEVIDQTTVIVYVGSQRCPFQLELRGTFCDLTYAPELFFHKPGDLQEGARPGDDIFGSHLGDRGLRVCANDLDIDIDGGAFTDQPAAPRPIDPTENPALPRVPSPFEPKDPTQPTDRYGNARSQCQVTDVVSLTDDQLVELYVARGLVPPPPPMGSGEIEVGAQEEPAPAEQAEPPATQSNVPSPSAATAAN